MPPQFRAKHINFHSNEDADGPCLASKPEDLNPTSLIVVASSDKSDALPWPFFSHDCHTVTILKTLGVIACFNDLVTTPLDGDYADPKDCSAALNPQRSFLNYN